MKPPNRSTRGTKPSRMPTSRSPSPCVRASPPPNVMIPPSMPIFPSAPTLTMVGPDGKMVLRESKANVYPASAMRIMLGYEDPPEDNWADSDDDNSVPGLLVREDKDSDNEGEEGDVDEDLLPALPPIPAPPVPEDADDDDVSSDEDEDEHPPPDKTRRNCKRYTIKRKREIPKRVDEYMATNNASHRLACRVEAEGINESVVRKWRKKVPTGRLTSSKIH